jgi:hypothetical protein
MHKASYSLILLAIVLLTGALAKDLTGDGWTQFRGPNGTGIGRVGNLPTEFGPSQNVIWKTPLPAGHSSPVLTDSQIS